MAILRFQKLHTQVVLSFALLLIVAQAAGLVALDRILARSTRVELQRSLLAGEKVFGEVCQSHGQQLVQRVRVLASDYAFRQAVGTGDRPTITSALVNHGQRIHAPVMVLVGLDGRVLADTLAESRAGQPFPFPWLLEASDPDTAAPALIPLGDRLFQWAAVPVLSPLPVAWLVVAVPVDHGFVADLQSLTGLEVSFLVSGPATPGWKALATTLADPSGLAGLGFDGPRWNGIRRLGGEDFATLGLRLSGDGRAPVVALLQRSVSKAEAPLRRLQKVLLLITGLSLAGALLASAFLARGLTRPIRDLGESARRIQEGDYSRRVPEERADEIGTLASAFNHMMQGLADRENRILDLAYRDQLTGLPNRILFRDRLGQELRSAARGRGPFTVLFLDLDRFREVNDIMGHPMGDRLLVEIAQRIDRGITREGDVVARLGGDEFALLLPGTDLAGAQPVAQRLSTLLQQPVLLGDQKISLGGGIGLAAYPEHGEEGETLLRRAELAMYEAKRNHAGFAIFDPAFDAQDPGRLSLAEDLRQAVVRGELVLFYQPKLSLKRGRVEQAEALVRWRHPERGLVPPGAFIPFAEKTGFIRVLTEWAIGEALRQSVAWRDQGLRVAPSVNLSARDLMNLDLPALFEAQLDRHGATPGLLGLEITESAMMADPAGALDILHRLHGLGFRLSIDDFGTGYSSLAYLKKLPVSELKIDQSFVTHMVSDRDDAVICRSTIDLGHTMGLEVVAEGVEDQATQDLLREMGCDLAQGYHIARPLPAEGFEAWIRQGPAWSS